MIPLIIATRNKHKVEEIRSVLGPDFQYFTLLDLPGAPDPAETGSTFAANARIKAHALAEWVLTAPAQAAPIAAHLESGGRDQAWVLADDSGLEVDALGGAPGVRSARFASEDFGLPGNAPDGANNAKLLRQLASVPAAARTGRFRCGLAFTQLTAGLPTFDFNGTCEGLIGFLPRGAHGFGYDPLFTPQGFEQTFAELGEATKNQLSHRARALEQLKAWWLGRIW